MNSFITLLLETLGISEAQTIEISKVMDCFNIQPNIMRDVLQPAMKGEKVGETLLPLMKFKGLESVCKETNLNVCQFNPHTKNGDLYVGEGSLEQKLC